MRQQEYHIQSSLLQVFESRFFKSLIKHSNMSGKIGSNTNDPLTANSRLFVGNLNTFALSQKDIEQIFRRYGFVIGISIHKGFAFIQYSTEQEARSALNSENTKTYANQQLDINLCSESKPKRTGHTPTAPPSPHGHGTTNAYMKPPPMHMNRISRDISKSPQAPQPQRLGGPPPKKLCQDFQDYPAPATSGIRRTLVTLSDNSAINSSAAQQPRRAPPSATASTTAATTKPILPSLRAAIRSSTGSPLSNQDILICGVCKLEFTNLHTLAQHKKLPCKLRFSCQCQKTPQPEQEQEALILNCATCEMTFFSAWSLVQHCQTEHSLALFKDGRQILDDSNGTSVKIELSSNDTTQNSTAVEVKQEPKDQ
ncbi:nuclear ribonucleoprotein C-like 3 [Octopus vulgaris]|uniref:Nuclear ribonucleoprotein C-like 3 n=3 Tax=Octopus TaxID=6643 RepID=A0AA36AYA1_OCTVU|nr:nuclear ribonucleoprotein C-like 3 [Octopus vulgaris]